MSDFERPFSDQEHAGEDASEDVGIRVPESLRADLGAVFRGEGRVPGAVDRAVLGAASGRFGGRRRVAWGGLAAAASVAVVGGVVVWSLTGPGPGPGPTGGEGMVAESSAAGEDADLNGDGSVDVLDALILAKAVDAGDSELDLTGDGASSAADVEALAARIVSLRNRG